MFKNWKQNDPRFEAREVLSLKPKRTSGTEIVAQWEGETVQGSGFTKKVSTGLTEVK